MTRDTVELIDAMNGAPVSRPHSKAIFVSRMGFFTDAHDLAGRAVRNPALLGPPVTHLYADRALRPGRRQQKMYIPHGGPAMTASLDPATQHRIERMVDDLCSEFAGDFPRPEIETVMADSVERIAHTARIYDFIPLMAYRFTCERLKRSSEPEASMPTGRGIWCSSASAAAAEAGSQQPSRRSCLANGYRSIQPAPRHATRSTHTCEPRSRNLASTPTSSSHDRCRRRTARCRRDRDDGAQRRTDRDPPRRSPRGLANRRSRRRPHRRDPPRSRRHRIPRACATDRPWRPSHKHRLGRIRPSARAVGLADIYSAPPKG